MAAAVELLHRRSIGSRKPFRRKPPTIGTAIASLFTLIAFNIIFWLYYGDNESSLFVLQTWADIDGAGKQAWVGIKQVLARVEFDDDVEQFWQLEEDEVRERMVELWEVSLDEKFMWYGAHSGFGNQVIQLKWALRMAGLLNRTLIVPPKLPHWNSIPSTGKCDSSPIPPRKIAVEAWRTYERLLGSPDYVSMGDVLDLTRIPSSLVRTIDLRHFVASFCRCFVGESCSGPWCHLLTQPRLPQRNIRDPCLARCSAMLGSNMKSNTTSKEWRRRGKVSLVKKSCGNTVWTLGKYNRLDDVLAAVGHDTSTMLPFVFSQAKQKRRPRPVNILEAIGPESPVQNATIMMFGSMFHPRIVDINLPGWPSHVERLRNLTAVLPFTPEIMRLGKQYAHKRLQRGFACLHVRGGDSFFEKNLFFNLRQQEAELKSVRKKAPSKCRDSQGRIQLFRMTDLKKPQWKHTILNKLKSLQFEVHDSSEILDQISESALRTLSQEYGLFANRLSREQVERLYVPPRTEKGRGHGSGIRAFVDIVLLVEQTVCSCSDLGFVGTPKSTASRHVLDMKKANFCSEP